MLSRLWTFQRDERGAVVVMVGAVLALLLLFAVYAIDASQMLLVKSQLQTAADAGALAGAIALGTTGDTTAAVNQAIALAGANDALQNTGTANTMESVVITSGDVTFPAGGQIRVTTHRTDGTGDSFLNYFLRIFDDDGEIGNMTARATASFGWVCGSDCLRPWAIVDDYVDADSNGIYDETGGDYYDPQTTGYTDSDIGVLVTLIRGQHSDPEFEQSWWYAIDYPPANRFNPIEGADRYREWVEGCPDNSFNVIPGDELQLEPGNVCCGQNNVAVQGIINSDASATWNSSTNEVDNSLYPVSPRIVKVPLFDPSIGVTDVANGRKRVTVVKVAAFFLESYNNGELRGRFMRMADPNGTLCANQSDPSFLFKTSLIE